MTSEKADPPIADTGRRKSSEVDDQPGIPCTEKKVEPTRDVDHHRRRLAIRLLFILVMLGLLYTLSLAKQLLVPMVLAFLFSLVLAPSVRWLERLYLPRPVGAGIIVLVLLTVFSYGVSESVTPVSNWIDSAPAALSKIELKVYPIKKTVEAVSKTAEQVDRITSVDQKPAVKIQDGSLREALYSNARSLIVGTVMAIILLYFLLSWGRILLLRLARHLPQRGSRHHFLVLSKILEVEVSRYLATITLINVCLGVLVAAVLLMVGMPNPVLWGVVAAILNFIPYLGGLVTVVFLGATALLSYDGMAVPLMVISSFIGLTIMEGQVLTPMIIGRRLALNPLVVFLSVVFWFWLWGVLGALMAVPMLIILKLIGEQVEFLRPVSSLLGR